MSQPRRRLTDRMEDEPDPLEQLVANAVVRALDRRFRLMTAISSTVALIAALAVSLPTVLVLSNIVSTDARRNSNANCQQIALSRPYGNARAFAQRLALDEEDRTLRHFVPQFERRESRRIDRLWQRELVRVRENGRLPAGVPAHIYSFDQLRSLAGDLPLLSCSRVVGR